MSQDTSSTGLFNLLFGWLGELLFKVLLIGCVIGAVVGGGLFLIFH